MARHKMVHERFARLAERVTLQEPPCMSDADDWESNNRWIDDLVPVPEPVNSLPTLPDAASEIQVPFLSTPQYTSSHWLKMR